jgi:hypothetical protein
MRTLNVRATIMILGILLTTACGPEPVTREPVRFTVGLHDVSLMEPEGWEHLDHGLEHRFYKELNSISVADIGPVNRAGYLRELNHALELFRAERLEDAKAHLGNLHLRWKLFSTREWDEISDAWHVALDGGLTKPVSTNDVELAYHALVQEIELKKPSSMADLVERLMPTLFSGTHREVGEQKQVEIDGRPGFRITTWDRLSHDHRNSFLLVFNNDNLLVIRMELGQYDEMQPVFDALVESLSLNPDQGSG